MDSHCFSHSHSLVVNTYCHDALFCVYYYLSDFFSPFVYDLPVIYDLDGRHGWAYGSISSCIESIRCLEVSINLVKNN